jgi:hypothetical protein
MSSAGLREVVMRRLVFALAFAVLAGRASAATVCSGDLPPPKLAAVDKPPAPQPQASPVLRADSPATADFPFMRELALQWRMNRDEDALKRLAAYFDAWVGVYRPSFDPISEESLTGFIDAYAVAAPDLPPQVRARVRPFLYALAQGYLHRLGVQDPRLRTDSRASRAVELATMAAWALADDNLMPQANRAYVRQLEAEVLPNGQVRDVVRTHRLAAAVDDLAPLARAAVAANNRGLRWLDLRGAHGQSLRRALDWLEPWAAGRRWWREPGQVANEGLWDRATSANLYWAASLLDDRYLATARSAGPVPPHWIWAQAPCGGAT